MEPVDLSKVKKEYVVLISIILTVSIVFVAYTNIFRPKLGKIKMLSAQIEQKRRNIQRARIGPEALKALEGEVKQMQTQLDYYQQRLQAPADIPQILKELTQIAEGQRIKFISVSPLEKAEIPLPAGDDKFLLQVPIQIKLKCGYHKLGLFINQIENSSRFMKVMELKITADSRDVWAHQTELVITSYSLVSKQSL